MAISGMVLSRIVMPMENTMKSEMVLMASRMLLGIFLKNRIDIGIKAPMIRNVKNTADPRFQNAAIEN